MMFLGSLLFSLWEKKRVKAVPARESLPSHWRDRDRHPYRISGSLRPPSPSAGWPKPTEPISLHGRPQGKSSLKEGHEKQFQCREINSQEHDLTQSCWGLQGLLLSITAWRQPERDSSPGYIHTPWPRPRWRAQCWFRLFPQLQWEHLCPCFRSLHVCWRSQSKNCLFLAELSARQIHPVDATG